MSERSGGRRMRIVVVGAGAIGLVCALRLAERGADVCVIDSSAPIMGPSERAASARAAGLLAPFSELLNEPPTAHRGLLALGLESLALWPRLAARLQPFALESFYSTPGALVLAGGGAHSGAVMRASQKAKEAGEPARLLPKKELADMLPEFAGKCDFALHLASEARVRPASAMVAMQRALRAETGARVLAGLVEGLALEEGRCVGVRLKPRAAGDAPLVERADIVVLTPGAWAADSLVEEVPALQRITPSKGHLIWMEAPKALAPMPLRAERFYMFAQSSKLVTIGSTMEPGKRDNVVDPSAVQRIQEAAAEMFPVLAERPALTQRAGVRAMSPDWGPLIGPAGLEGCFIAAGHARNGWLLAPVTAEILCARVFEAPVPALWGAFSPDRFG